jgi:hypothetical protein
MIRTQIQLTDEQASGVKRLAAERQVSMAEVIRDSLDRTLAAPQSAVSHQERVRRAIAAAGRFRSGGRDGSVRHDPYLAEAYQR